MTPRGRAIVLLVIALGWLALAAVNFSRGQSRIGVVYGVVGLLSLGLAAFFRPRGRRSR